MDTRGDIEFFKDHIGVVDGYYPFKAGFPKN